MIRLYQFMLVGCFLWGSSASFSSNLCDRLNHDAIQKIIDTDRMQYHIPGLSLSVYCADENAPHDFFSGTTTLASDQQITSDSLFQVGSVTKSFIAVLLLQLEAEGVLSLEDPISRWLTTIPAAWHDITIRQLLNHTSGIYNHTDVLHDIFASGPHNDLLTKQWTSQELVDLAASKPLYFESGKGWRYSNTNYVIAGMIIEAATHQRLNEVLQARILNPLQLKNTYYLPGFLPSEIVGRMAHGYSMTGLFPQEPYDVTSIALSWAGAAGSIISDSHDIALWFSGLMHGKVLNAVQQAELMTTVSMDNGLPYLAEDNTYGLGVMHDMTSLGQESWWHSGGTLGYSAYMTWLKQQDIVISVTLNDADKNRNVYSVTKDIAHYLESFTA